MKIFVKITSDVLADIINNSDGNVSRTNYYDANDFSGIYAATKDTLVFVGRPGIENVYLNLPMAALSVLEELCQAITKKIPAVTINAFISSERKSCDVSVETVSSFLLL